jgi:hypothetical protein
LGDFLFVGVFIFGSVRFLSKKVTKPNFKKKKLKPVQTDRFRFGFLEQNRFKPVWLGFFGLLRFFWFFRFGFGSVFPVPGLKNQNRTELVGFFKILIGFFSRFGFFGYFFSDFLGLIGFLVFLNTPTDLYSVKGLGIKCAPYLVVWNCYSQKFMK